MKIPFPRAADSENFEIKETHLSKVYLFPEFVFKFKKEILFPFCDYSTKEKRFSAAWDEVLLNRRGAPTVYLGVALFNRRNDGSLFFSNQSLLVSGLRPKALEFDEVAVVMRRIPEKDFLEQKLSSSDKRALISPVSASLNRFFSNCAPYSDAKQYYQALSGAVRENIVSLETILSEHQSIGVLLPLLQYIGEWQKRQLSQMQNIITARVHSGFVIDGHGDLRTDHLAVIDGEIQIIDCVEFNRDLRINDILSEIAFLSISLESRLRSDLSSDLEDSFLQGADREELQSLLTLFKSYRALVRAKVHGLRLSQLAKESQEHDLLALIHYLGIALRSSLQLRGPALILVSGLMGTGKSTLATGLAQCIAGHVLSSDLIRKQASERELHSQHQEAFGTGLYSPEVTDQTYAHLKSESEELLAHGEIVIADATFLKRRHRREFILLAEKYEIKPILLHCELEANTHLKRLAARAASGTAVSEGRPELLERQSLEAEKVASDEGFAVITVDTKQITTERCIELAGLIGSHHLRGG